MNTYRRPYLGGIILITLGILFLLDTLNIADFGDLISTYWPLILIFVGFSILSKNRRHQANTDIEENTGSYVSDEREKSDVSAIRSSSVFGDLDLKFSSKDFRGGSISNVFGDTNIDLSEIALADGEHLLKVDGMFGDLHVLVPKDIEIYVAGKSVFGDVRVLGNLKTGFGQEINYSSTGYPTASRKLRLYAHQVFGDVRIW
ncbi:MAG: cell wall-active antibiotics response protein [Bacteroidota bacterium]|nr:cell wall-active antibiotics response protein [Bacteroidota bacterium]